MTIPASLDFYDDWRSAYIESCRLFEDAMLYRFSPRTIENADRAIRVMALEAILEEK